ncbi:MAG: hypothetical protein ACOCWA_03455 [Bacteroidota bacterium]
MKSQSDHIQDIREIRRLMERSSRFISLSGFSGISAGLFALIGAGIAHLLLKSNNIIYDEYYRTLGAGADRSVIGYLMLDALIVLILALLSAYYFSARKAKKMNTKFWNPAAKQMIVSLFIPLVTGGLLILILLYRTQINFVAPLTLIFYGLGLINAGKYSGVNINYLGFVEITLGLIAMIFINYGLLFWTIGFGVMHIIYGLLMHFKYER